ncbi:MAG: trypsin-like serine protease [Thermodesulfobacteriota bacterium]|nr:trypsin-like serine protease [Thermodesulfobacteriota bacterium]
MKIEVFTLKTIGVMLLMLILHTIPVGAENHNALPKPRIIGGAEADSDAWPWMAAIVDRDKPDIYQGQFCGGTLIHPDWVLTAAHCVHDELADINIDVVLGTNDLGSSPGSYERIPVAEIVEHPRYNHFTLNNDIALLRLSQSSGLTPIPSLITPANAFDLASPGHVSTVIGWGDTHINPWLSDYPELLMEVDLPIVSNADAKRIYGWLITDNMLCAGFKQGGRDTCQGDSGGPLMVDDGQGSYAQAGIISWGEGCALAGYYGIYTRVSRYIDWISTRVDLEARCGDYNNDGTTDYQDISEIGSHWLVILRSWTVDCWSPMNECGDYDGNGIIDQQDLNFKRLDFFEEFTDWLYNCWLPTTGDPNSINSQDR